MRVLKRRKMEISRKKGKKWKKRVNESTDKKQESRGRLLIREGEILRIKEQI